MYVPASLGYRNQQIWYDPFINFLPCDVSANTTIKIMIMHHCLTGAASRYLTELAVPVTTRQYCSPSLALGVICWSCRAFNSPFNHQWPCVCCCRSTSVEQPTIWHSIIYITSSFSTFKKHLKSYLFQLYKKNTNKIYIAPGILKRIRVQTHGVTRR